MPRTRMLHFLLLSTALIATPAVGEVSTRECIQYVAPPGPAYVIPANTQVTLAEMSFALYDTSNAVFAAQIFFPDAAGQTFGQRARFDLLVDGATTNRLTTPIQYYNRTPFITMGTVNLRAFYVNLAMTVGSTHVLSLVVNNTSPNSFVVEGVYMNALFIDAAQPSVGIYKPATQPVGATYTEIGRIDVPPGTNGHLFVSSFIRASAPVTPQTITFRYLVNGTQTEVKTLNIKNTDDGATVEYLIQNAVPGQPVVLQAMMGSGTGSVTVVEMAAQAMEAYDVMGYSQDNVYSSNTGGANWINYGPSPGVLPPQITLTDISFKGAGGSACMWGTSDSTVSIAPAGPQILLVLGWLINGSRFPFDLGRAPYSPDGTPAGYHQQSDFGCGAGISRTNTYGLQQSVNNQCNTPPVPTWTLSHQRLQEVVLPAPCQQGVSCNEPWPGTNCELDNHTCPGPRNAGNPCFGVPCPNTCKIDLTSTITSTSGLCN